VTEEIELQKSSTSSLQKRLLQLAVVALLIYAIVFFAKRYSADFSILENITWQYIVTIGAWSFFSYTAYAFAVYLILVELGLQSLRPIEWIKIYFVSRLVNFVILQGGNLYRLIVLKKKYGFSYTNSIGAMGFLIWINAQIALLMSIIGLAYIDGYLTLASYPLILWCGILLAVLVILPLFVETLTAILEGSSVSHWWLIESLVSVAKFFKSTLRKRAHFALIGVVSGLHFALFVGVNYFSFRAIGQSLELAVVCIYTTAFVFTRYVNVVPGNVGVSELVGGLVSEQLGVGFGSGLVVAGIVRVVELIMIVVAGAAYGNVVLFETLMRRRL